MESMQFFRANFTVIVVSGQTLLKEKYDCVYFVLCSRRFSYHESSARTTFGKLCQRPIEMEEFSEEGRSLNFRVTLFVLDVKISYREG